MSAITVNIVSKMRHATSVASVRALMVILTGSLAFPAENLNAFAAPLNQGPESFNAAHTATQTCRSNGFSKFFRLYVGSEAARERFSANQINTAPTGVQPDFVSKSEYLKRFPLAARGWNYISSNGQSPAEDQSFVLVRSRAMSKTVWRVDFASARFDVESADGKWIGVPIELLGTLGALTFVATGDGCWQLTDDVRSPKSSPFQLGVQPLRCTIRSNDYGRALQRLTRDSYGQPEDMDAGRDLAICAKLMDKIEMAIRRSPKLVGLRRRIDKKLAALARLQTPAAHTALMQDERRFRRSLMRDQYVLADGTTGDWDMPADLEQRLAGRLAELALIAPSRQDYPGEWINASGTLDIRHDGDTYKIDANPVDIDFLAWTCEFEGDMHRTKVGLELGAAEGETVHARLQDGVLVVEHFPTSGGIIETCGAGGSISGTYFPTRPQPKPPAGLEGGPPLEFVDP